MLNRQGERRHSGKEKERKREREREEKQKEPIKKRERKGKENKWKRVGIISGKRDTILEMRNIEKERKRKGQGK